MADFVFNVAKGKVSEYASRVNANDPANSALVLVVLATAGLETDAVLRDKDTLADVLSGTTNEVTNASYARKVLDQAGGITITVDDANDRVDVDIPDQTWSAIAAGDGWSKLLVCYDPDTTGGTDASIVPLVALDFVLTPDGTDLMAQLNAAGFYRAS
jgi:hypothetical protein